jgi:alpha/beta superfamily hydrolase
LNACEFRSCLNAQTQRILIDGPAGSLELAIDHPQARSSSSSSSSMERARPDGLALVAHPHPLFGGTLDNKVVQTIARSMVSHNMICIRPNFRGVGQSQGQHDNGNGEQEDLWAAWRWAEQQYGDQVGPQRWMGGFSFGAVMVTHVYAQWRARRQTPGLLDAACQVSLLVGLAAERFAPSPIDDTARLIHGEQDEVVSLASVMRFAQSHRQPVAVMPGAGHFFHGALPDLRKMIDHALADV